MTTTRGEAADLEPGHPDSPDETPRGMRRRGFLGWVLAAPTLAVGTSLLAEGANPEAAGAAVPSPPEPADLYDLGDAQDDAALPTSHLITVVINPDGSASFALPRTEVGQGTSTMAAMVIADELDLPIKKVTITLADARPELVFNQLTGGSNSVRSMYQPIRDAAALAKAKLVEAAAAQWGIDEDKLTTKNGEVISPGGKRLGYGSLTKAAAASKLTRTMVTPKDPADFTVIGKPTRRIDAYAAVTGRKVFTTDLEIPNALPTMVARPPTVLGTPKAVTNLAQVKAMPGVTDVAMISTGVAVRAATHGQCIDAIRALKVTWNPGPNKGKSDASMLTELRNAQLPMTVPQVPILATTIDREYIFYTRSNSALEPGAAVASYTPQGIQVWSCLKVPIAFQEELGTKYGMLPSQIKVHVITGGGSFGRHLFADAGFEAVEASKAFGKPVKLMWSRTDDFRQGRIKPMATSRVRATYLLGNVLTYEQRHTSIATDFSHGLGEIVTAVSGKLPPGKYTLSQSIWLLTANVSYNYGITDQLLNETDNDFLTGAMRNVYSPDMCTAQELMTDELAKLAGLDPYQFRRQFVKDPRGVAVLDKVAQVGGWGRSLPPGMAQGIAVHNEYKGWAASLIEIDCRPATVNRKIYDAFTGPRVTKAIYAVDVGMTINPMGLEAQMQGGMMDGIAQALTSSMHLYNGYWLEGSWDDYFYTREWNVPPEMKVIIMPNTSDSPGGAGEFGVAATMSATACAYQRAMKRQQLSYPVSHHQPLGFDPFPPSPSTPQSPTDGLKYAY